MTAFHTILLLGFVVATLVWAALSVYVSAIDRRRIRSRSLLSAVMNELRLEDIRTLPLEQRVAQVQRLLDRASRELVMQAAADPQTSAGIFDTLTAYLLQRYGLDGVVRDAESHRTAREKWRRTAALRILAHGGHTRSLELLARASDDADSDVALAALALLGASSDPAAIDILLAALKHRRHPASRVAVHLDQSPQPIADRLLPLLHDDDAVVRFWAATLLARYFDRDDLELDLAPLADDPDPRVRKAAVESLGQIGGDLAATVALRLLNDPVAFVRAHAARALAHLDRSDFAEHVALLLGDPDWWVRLAAKESLQTMGAEVWRVLYRRLNNPDEFVRNGAAEVFQNLGILDSLVVMEAATDHPSGDKVEMLRRIADAGGLRLTDSLLERADPVVAVRMRRLLDTIGLQHVGAA